MSECTKQVGVTKYSYRNSPPYPANKCKTMKKRGNDGKYYNSKPDKNGVYKWVAITAKNKTTKVTLEDLRKMAKKYNVAVSGTKQTVAQNIMQLRGSKVTKTDKNLINQVL